MVGATVKVHNDSTGVDTNLLTNAACAYTKPPFVLGTYSVTMDHAGFKTAVRSGVQVLGAETVRQDIALAVGAVTESVEVKADTELNTTTPDVSHTVDEKYYRELPVITAADVRLAESMLQIQPGYLPMKPNGDPMFRGSQFNSRINGRQTMATENFFDGAAFGYAVGHQQSHESSPPVESIQEMKVITTSYSAQNGHTSGGSSSTSPNPERTACNGSAYEYLANDALNARGFFDAAADAVTGQWHSLKKTPVRNNSFGFTLGGPVVIPKVYNGRNKCFLYHNNGTFSEVGLVAGVGYNEDGKTFAGMGTDFSDFDNDGLPDIVVTDLSNERYMLFRNNGDGTFRDITNRSGLGSATLTFSGWSTHFFDYDNDGWKDLFVAQSHVMDTIEKTAPNLRYLEPPLLLRNQAGHFAKVMAGEAFHKSWAGRGAAFGDIDNDGDLDVVVSNVGQKAYILRNDGGNSSNWIAIETIGKKSNRDGIGARIKIVTASGSTQYYTVNTAVGYLSASDKRVIAGLGADSTAKLVEIRWPSGIVQKFENVKARQTLKAVEPVQ